MSHVRKLQLSGSVHGRNQKVQSYYSWPLGKRQSEVEALIDSFKRAFENVTVVLYHNHFD